jgi:hypothetical protein
MFFVLKAHFFHSRSTFFGIYRGYIEYISENIFLSLYIYQDQILGPTIGPTIGPIIGFIFGKGPGETKRHVLHFLTLFSITDLFFPVILYIFAKIDCYEHKGETIREN